MMMNRIMFFALLISLHLSSLRAKEIDSKLSYEVPGVTLTLVAENPQVATPTGIDVDQAGRIWVVSSHTHFRPDNYEGPKHDEIIVLDGTKRHVFYNATDATMDLELGDDGWVYLAERDRILRIKDTNGDNVADREEVLATLDTEAVYPHNGLAGFAWHPDGDLVFSLGENFAKTWVLTAADGSKVEGTGEGGIFRMDASGTNLRRIAQGFWNPFGVCIRSDGSMFAAENDPGARPPCRLLHVVEGGDYGYQRKYGGAPVHPFVAWNGELLGTLPMLHASGEAPCGIAPLGNAGVIVPSWTENRIDFYPLNPNKHSYSASQQILVRGSREFRPTCIAAVPRSQSDATGDAEQPYEFVLADWTIGSYNIHGHGRIWRLSILPTKADWFDSPEELQSPEKPQVSNMQFDQLLEIGGGEDPFLAHAAIAELGTRAELKDFERLAQLEGRMGAVACRAMSLAMPKNQQAVGLCLAHRSEDVQFEALRWISDQELSDFKDIVQRKFLSSSGVSFRLFEAALACANTLDGNPEAGVSDRKLLISRVKDSEATPKSRAYALRLLSSGSDLPFQLLAEFTASGEAELAFEAVRSLAGDPSEQATELLKQVAMDSAHIATVRCEAIVSLGSRVQSMAGDMLALASASEGVLQNEALRALRAQTLTDSQKSQLAKLKGANSRRDRLIDAAINGDSAGNALPLPDDMDAWKQHFQNLDGKPNAESGRRIFFNARVGTCSQCHRFQGRGNVVGPDFSSGFASDPNHGQRLLRALLQPSRDVSPQYFTRILVTEDGQSFTGILLRDGGGGTEYYRDRQGKEVRIKSDEVVARRESTESMMPKGLHLSLTIDEIRDLLHFVAMGSQPFAKR